MISVLSVLSVKPAVRHASWKASMSFCACSRVPETMTRSSAEGRPGDQKLGGLLERLDLAQRDRARAPAVSALHAARAGAAGRLLARLGAQSAGGGGLGLHSGLLRLGGHGGLGSVLQ